MKSISTLIIALIICAANAFATAQSPDYIIYEGEKHALYTNPLDAFFEKHPDKKPEMTSTANWRGYVATFAITNNTLVLKDIETEVYEGESESTISIKTKVFGNTDDQLIDWFTGILTLPQGEVENYVHMGYGSTYSKYTLLEIKNGKLGKVRQLDSEEYDIFRAHQYAAFKKTEKYREVIKEMEDFDPHKHDDFIRGYFAGTYSSILLDDAQLNTKLWQDKIYEFQHVTLPYIFFEIRDAAFSDLKNGAESKIVEIAEEVVNDEFAKALVIQPVQDREAYTITFPKPTEAPECYFSLIIKMDDDYLYFTLERGIDLLNSGTPPRELCQWKNDEHINYGMREYRDLKSFITDVTENNLANHH